jgi:hypothetical protein
MFRLGQVSLTKADPSKNSPSMLLSATSEALARLRVSDLTAAAPCGPSLFFGLSLILVFALFQALDRPMAVLERNIDPQSLYERLGAAAPDFWTAG